MVAHFGFDNGVGAGIGDLIVLSIYIGIALFFIPWVPVYSKYRYLFKGGAISFFLGCAASHYMWAAMHLTSNGTLVFSHWMMIAHTMQIVGGALFLGIGIFSLEISFKNRKRNNKYEKSTKIPVSGK